MSKWTYILSDHACECGCGKLTYLAPFTWAARGLVAGEPQRFVSGHYQRDLIERPSLAERFAAHVVQGGIDECWPWKGSIDVYGYGYLGFGGKQIKAHRASYELYIGPIPEGLGVLHHCDNPPCVNYLSHLFLGTQIDNNADMNAKGRGIQGERNPMAKLTKTAAENIRALLKKDIGIQLLADSYGVSFATVYDVAAGRTWKASNQVET